MSSISICNQSPKQQTKKYLCVKVSLWLNIITLALELRKCCVRVTPGYFNNEISKKSICFDRKNKIA